MGPSLEDPLSLPRHRWAQGHRATRPLARQSDEADRGGFPTPFGHCVDTVEPILLTDSERRKPTVDSGSSHMNADIPKLHKDIRFFGPSHLVITRMTEGDPRPKPASRRVCSRHSRTLCH